jgi:hypothetical protein
MNELLKQFIPNPPRIKAIECGALNNEDSNYYLVKPITYLPTQYLLVLEYLPAVESADLWEEVQSICAQNLGVEILNILPPLSNQSSELIITPHTNAVNLMDYVLTTFSADKSFLADYLLLKVSR